MLHTPTKDCKTEDDIFIHPNIKAAKSDHKQMEQIAEDKTLTDAEKVQEHSQILKHYLENFKDAVEINNKQAILGNSESASLSSPPPEQTEEMKIDKVEPVILKSRKTVTSKPPLGATEIVNTLPSHKRLKARKLLRDIERSKVMKWSGDGKVIYNGKVLRGSNITKLVADSVGSPLQLSSTKTTWKKFNEILNDHGITTKQEGAGISEYKNFKKHLKHTNWYCYE